MKIEIRIISEHEAREEEYYGLPELFIKYNKESAKGSILQYFGALCSRNGVNIIFDYGDGSIYMMPKIDKSK